MLFFFHGLESGPHGSKYRALDAKFGSVESPDFSGIKDVEARLAIAEQATRGKMGLVIVGSSFGGLCAALLAHRHPERVVGLVLCAPALHWEKAAETTRVPVNAIILHGVNDEVAPISHSEAFAAAHDIQLVTVDDDHRLSQSRDLLLELVASRFPEHLQGNAADRLIM